MQFDNQTRFPAKLFRTSIEKDRLAASLALRVTYEWRDGCFTPAAEQSWIVSGPPWESPYGLMPSDELFFRGGVDIFIFGQARPKRGENASVVDVQAEIGSFTYGVRVFGDRVWQRTDRGLVPSAPQPITAVPLTLEHAFGGTVQWDGLDVPFTPNPAGKGFYIEEAEAQGKPLPNIEDPAHLIAKWEDRPMPVGVGACPPNFAGKVFALLDPDTSAFSFSPKLFNAAFPSMVAPGVSPGDILTVRGISAAGETRLSIPAHRFETVLTFDDEIIIRSLAIDQVGVEFDKQRIFVSYRYPFRYILYKRQQRNCTLREVTFR